MCASCGSRILSVTSTSGPWPTQTHVCCACLLCFACSPPVFLPRSCGACTDNARYPMPSESSGSVSNLWWSRDIGPVHIIALCSYAATAAGSLQYEWLASDLAAVDRQSTPWLLVMMHAPWYNSNSGHIAEAELMRRDMEPLLFQYGVDVVLSGHVHAYERVAPVLNGCLNSCGPVYLNLGDGGNCALHLGYAARCTLATRPTAPWLRGPLRARWSP